MKRLVYELNNELNYKSNLKEAQEVYNYYLDNSKYNRRVSDYRNGEYLNVGNNIRFLLNSKENIIKYNFGYNFNHTGSPFYLNYNNKLNVLKLQKIMKRYMYSGSVYEKQFFITLTMPNLSANVFDVDDNNKLVKTANQTITNLYKQLQNKFESTGMIKKYECTYKYMRGEAKSNPHFHLLISFKDLKSTRWMKSTHDRKSVADFIFEYWFNNFVVKHFPEITKDDARAAYDMQEVNQDKICEEMVGYVSKGTNRDYLKSQEIFDYFYNHMHNKRVLTYLGIFKKINKDLKLEEIDDIDELDDTDVVYDMAASFYYHRKDKKYKISYVRNILPLNSQSEFSGLDNSTSSSKSKEQLIYEYYKNQEIESIEVVKDTQKIQEQQLSIKDLTNLPGQN